MTQTLQVPQHISRTFIQQHPAWIFVYSYDVVGKGFFGQCNAAHGEENAYPVPTIYKWCPSAKILFQDSRRDEQWQYIRAALDKIPRDGRPIIPFRRIGLGCSRMQEFAPRMWQDLQTELKAISYSPIEWLWKHT